MDECVDDKHTYIIVQNTKLGVSKTCNTMYTNPTICLYIFNDYYYFISKKKKITQLHLHQMMTKTTLLNMHRYNNQQNNDISQ
jgi:hypothetical protein